MELHIVVCRKCHRSFLKPREWQEGVSKCPLCQDKGRAKTAEQVTNTARVSSDVQPKAAGALEKTANGFFDCFKLLNSFFGIVCLVLAPFTCGLSLLFWGLFTGTV